MFDLVFLSHGEPHAETHWRDLAGRFPTARRIDGVDGIREAHRVAAEKSRTAMVWVVDADNEVRSDFRFDHPVPEWDRAYVHLFHARNPVNDLEYGWGGIKLFPRRMLLAGDSMGLDMTTGFPLKIIPKVASTTHFDTSPETAWRSAFREAVKLSVSDDPEAAERLAAWRRRARGPYAAWVLAGAADGEGHGHAHRDDPTELRRINDWSWLAERFARAAS